MITAFRVTDINHPVVKEMGFKTRDELLAESDIYEELVNGDWPHMFILQYNEDTGEVRIDTETERPAYTISAWIDTRAGDNNLWFEAMCTDSYHVEMSELLSIMEIVYAFTKAGILEKVEVE